MKILLFVLALVCADKPASAVSPEEVDREKTVHNGSSIELFRDYALVACLGQAAPQIMLEASATQNGYVQYGGGPYEAYKAVTDAADNFLQRDYAHVGADLGLMKCNDFVRSRALDAVVRKYFPISAHGRASKHGPR